MLKNIASHYHGRIFEQYIQEHTLVELLKKIDSAANNGRKYGFETLVEENIMAVTLF